MNFKKIAAYTGKKIFDEDSSNHIVKSRTVITKILGNTSVHDGYKQVDFWKLCLFVFFIITLIAILIGSIILFTADRPAFYMENCSARSCMPFLKMKCVNNTCQCTSNQYYAKGCLDKRSFSQSCSSQIQCNSNLNCFNGKCDCNSSHFWLNERCSVRKTYGQYCLRSYECLQSSMLECNSSSGLCSCDSSRFWNGQRCLLKRTFMERCANTYECLSSQDLDCISGVCTCNAHQKYFDDTLMKCLNKANETEYCYGDKQCYGDMTCVSSSCTCHSKMYFDSNTLVCTNKTLNNTSCSSNRTCRTDLGLGCQTSLCQCDASRKFWQISTSVCTSYLNYSQLGCIVDSHCVSGKGLICNSNSTTNSCDCPSTSTIGMCDCTRISGSEYYWDSFMGGTCKLAIGEWQACDSTYQCITPMYCNSTSRKCQCAENFYFNSTADACLAKSLINTPCLSDATCRTDLGLTCQLSTCKCDATIKFWSNATNGCINYIAYGQLGCSSDAQCEPNSNLFCNLNRSLNACNCPITSMAGMCDCVRVVSNETYWSPFVSKCVTAATHGQACVVGTSYTCRTLSELTSCSSSTGVCECLRGSDRGYLRASGVCGYCPVSWKYLNANCYGLIPPGNYTNCGASQTTCMMAACGTGYTGSTITMLATPTIFNLTVSLFPGQLTTGTFIGGFALGAWTWRDSTAIIMTNVPGSWQPGKPSSSSACLAIEPSTLPQYYLETSCNSNFNLMCQIPF